MGTCDGRVVIVTGAARGLGRAHALAFAAEGSHVAICGRREEPLLETAGLHTGENAILTMSCDVADRESTGRFFSWVEETLGGIDIIVINAGINVSDFFSFWSEKQQNYEILILSIFPYYILLNYNIFYFSKDKYIL